MSNSSTHTEILEKDVMIREGGPWSGAWKVAAGIGAVGAALTAAGAFTDHTRFAFAYLYAFCAFLMIALGGLFFVIVQHLVSANWSVTVRRTAEFLASGLPVFAVLAVPVFLSFPTLCPMLAKEHTGGKHAMLAAFEGNALAQPAPAGSAAAPAAAAPHAAGSAEAHAAPAGSAAAAPSGGTAAVGVTPSASGIAAPTAPHGDEEAAEAHAANEAAKPQEHAAGVATDPHGTAAGAHVGAEHAEHDPHHFLHAQTLERKRGYFAPGFYYGRAVFYVAVWSVLGLMFFRSSVKQDKVKGFEITKQAYARSPASLALFALTLTFAMFDWIMALEPSWFSTIFGLYMFATAVVSSLTVITLITMSLREAGYVKDLITVEHFHDLGKLLFGFTVFWAYIAFSQFMLIWYAGLPEETTYYHTRWDDGPWAFVSMVVLFGHFVVPLFFFMSRNIKRDLPKFKIGVLLYLPFHFIEWYWLVMPNLMPADYTFHWVDFTALMAVGGLYFAAVFYNMTKHALIPIGDPRLQRSIHFQNA